MSDRIELGTFMGLRFNAHPNTIYNSLLLWAALAIVGYSFLDLPLLVAITTGLVATLLHWDSEIWHQLGGSDHGSILPGRQRDLRSRCQWKCLFLASAFIGEDRRPRGRTTPNRKEAVLTEDGGLRTD